LLYSVVAGSWHVSLSLAARFCVRSGHETSVTSATLREERSTESCRLTTRAILVTLQNKLGFHGNVSCKSTFRNVTIAGHLFLCLVFLRSLVRGYKTTGLNCLRVVQCLPDRCVQYVYIYICIYIHMHTHHSGSSIFVLKQFGLRHHMLAMQACG
jgi:hypothetical protein